MGACLTLTASKKDAFVAGVETQNIKNSSRPQQISRSVLPL
jgi:hypothetical protein